MKSSTQIFAALVATLATLSQSAIATSSSDGKGSSKPDKIVIRPLSCPGMRGI